MPPIVVIVESPTKAKSIQQFLGDDYIVVASKGHIADLPERPKVKGSLGIDISVNPPKVSFPEGFPVLDDKKSTVAHLKSLCKGRTVILATDPDREGEAISWNLKHELKSSAKEFFRATFDAITPEGVAKGMAHMRDIDSKLVAAQLGRRSLDRLFGYGLSGLAGMALMTRGISVGRVQTAVLSMIVDRENEIKNFKPEPRYTVILKDTNGDEWRSPTVPEKDKAERLLAYLVKQIQAGKVSIGDVKRGKRAEAPPQPFRTGTMQQVAGKMMGLSPTKVMDVAQSLFERHHLITYHRSDSVRVSEETAADQLKFAREVWPDLVPEKPTVHKNRNGAQDAHECIHPSYMDGAHAPDKVKHMLTPEEHGLYTLIWGRFHASRAKPAVWDTLEAFAFDDTTQKPLPLKLSGAKLVFDGWRRLDPSAPKSKDRVVNVQPVKGTRLGGNASMDKTFTKPPSPYTTSDLIKDMEKNGVGRPATMASSIDVLFRRGYVIEKKAGKMSRLEPTETGRNVVAWAGKVCPELRDPQYTSQMEEDLDLVCTGEKNWHKVVVDFHENVIVPSRRRGWDEVNAAKEKGGAWKNTHPSADAGGGKNSPRKTSRPTKKTAATSPKSAKKTGHAKGMGLGL